MSHTFYKSINCPQWPWILTFSSPFLFWPSVWTACSKDVRKIPPSTASSHFAQLTSASSKVRLRPVTSSLPQWKVPRSMKLQGGIDWAWNKGAESFLFQPILWYSDICSSHLSNRCRVDHNCDKEKHSIYEFVGHIFWLLHAEWRNNAITYGFAHQR